MTLTEFLLARIAEDEAQAGGMLETGYQPPAHSPDDRPEFVPDFYDPPTDSDRRFVARVLVECAAKRRIVGLRDSWPQQSDRDEDSDPILRTMATVYADHPDYDQSWRI